MNNIKDSFFIQDLEIYSGIKAHTIRIWEKRYNLLSPTRLNRNIRKYSLLDLQKLLNVSVLYKSGYKISKLSKLTEEELNAEARSSSDQSVKNNFHLNTLIMSMYSFDSGSFEKSYQELIAKVNFEEIFTEIYVPLLNHIGVLWLTEAIKPAHEHFISNLISQKIILNTSQLSNDGVQTKDDEIFVLFLPKGEIHDIGLLYLNLCLKKANCRTIYLGQSVPFDNLQFVDKEFKNVTWICSFVIDKTPEEKSELIDQLGSLIEGTNNKVYLTGWIWENYEKKSVANNIHFISHFKNLDFL